MYVVCALMIKDNVKWISCDKSRQWWNGETDIDIPGKSCYCANFLMEANIF